MGNCCPLKGASPYLASGADQNHDASPSTLFEGADAVHLVSVMIAFCDPLVKTPRPMLRRRIECSSELVPMILILSSIRLL